MCDSCDDEFHIADVGQRAFLNKPGYHSIGAVGSNCSVRIYEQSKRTEPNRWSVACEGELRLSDCTRSITLDLSVYHGDEEAIENVFYKLDELARVVLETREQLTEAIEKARTQAKRKNKIHGKDK